MLNHLVENFTTTDILFFTTYALTAGLITGMSIKRIFFESNVAPPTPGSGTWQSTVQALSSPTVQPSSPVEHELTQESLRYLQEILEENDPNSFGMQTISNKNDVGMQTEMDITDSVLLNQVNYSTAEAQTTEVLNVNTSNLNEMYLDQLDDFGVDITDLFTSNTENLLSSNQSTQTLFTSAETGMQTVDLNSEVGMQTIGSQLGLGATMGGVATAVGKAVAKSGVPPLQKAGIILGSSALSGLVHSKLSIMNRNMINETGLNTSTSTDTNSNISKFISDSISSPLQDLLVNFEMTNYVCLGLIYIIMIQLIFKIYFKDEINLKNSYMLNANWITDTNYYLNKIIKSNKQMSIIWIWLGILVITFALLFDAYTLHDVYTNIDSYVNIHKSSHFYSNNLLIIDTSILHRLIFSRIINFIGIINLFYLILILIRKFHLEKGVSNILIWILIILLILDLSFSAYIYNDLYTNIDSYVNMYINMKK
jgi:hypothetical protein